MQAEVVAVATDLAEIVGGSLALNLLFGVPVVVGALITTAVSTALLLLQSRRRQKTFERVVTGMLAIVAVGFLAGLLLDAARPGRRRWAGSCPGWPVGTARCWPWGCSGRR